MEHETPMVVRPTSGSRHLRRNASIRLEGSAIVATDRKGRSRTFRLEQTDDAPGGLRGAEGVGNDSYYLEDRQGRALVRLHLLDWHVEELMGLGDAAGLKTTDSGTPPDRPEMMRIEDPPYFAWAGLSAAVGMAAVSLYWLHIVPEAVMMFVALPALILFVWFTALAKLAFGSSKYREERAKQVHEESQKELAHLEELEKRYPDLAVTDPEPETDKP